MAIAQCLPRIADRPPPAAIPDVDVAGSVLTGRNVAFEVRIVERMVLDLHGEPAFAWPFARAFGDRPALQHTVELQTKIEMEPTRFVPLDYEAELAAAAPGTTRRLRRDVEVALAAISRERCRHRRHGNAARANDVPTRTARRIRDLCRRLFRRRPKFFTEACIYCRFASCQRIAVTPCLNPTSIRDKMLHQSTLKGNDGCRPQHARIRSGDGRKVALSRRDLYRSQSRNASCTDSRQNRRFTGSCAIDRFPGRSAIDDQHGTVADQLRYRSGRPCDGRRALRGGDEVRRRSRDA